MLPGNSFLRPVAQGLRSQNVQCACQLVVGELIVAIFVFVRPVRFQQACLGTTLYMVAQLIVARDQHIGSKTIAAATLLGPAWLGAVLGGAVLSLAHAPGKAHTGSLTAFSILFVGLCAVVRCGPHAATATPTGIVMSMLYGQAIVYGQTVWPANMLWNKIIGQYLLASAIVALATFLSGLLVLPSLAGREVHDKTAAAITGLSNAISRYSDLLFAEAEPHLPGNKDVEMDMADYRLAEHSSRPHPKLADGADDQQMAAKANFTSPPHTGVQQHVKAISLPALSLPFTGLAPTVTGSKLKDNHSSSKAPPCQPAPEGEETQEEYLEMLQQVTAPNARSCMLNRPGVKPVNSLRTTLNRIHFLLEAEVPHEPMWLRPCCSIHPGKWTALLASAEVLIERIAALETILEEPYQVLRSSSMQRHWGVDPALLMRAAMSHAGSACTDVAACVRLHGHSRGMQLPAAGKSQQGYACSLRAEVDALLASAVQHYWDHHADFLQGEEVLRTDEVRALMFALTLVVGIVDSSHALQQAAEQALCWQDTSAGSAEADRKQRPDTKGPTWYSWAMPSLCMILNIPILQRFLSVLKCSMHLCTGQGPSLQSILQDRRVQFGLKYWAVLAACCAIILPLGQVDGFAQWAPYFAFLTASICMSEKVEATLSQGLLRVVASALGGIIGFLLLLRVHLANSPYFQVVLMLACTFAFGLLGPTALFIEAVVVLNSIGGTVFCEYKGCCNFKGPIQPYISLVVATAIGVALCIAVSDLLLPWYTSAAALSSLASAYSASLQLTKQYCLALYRIMEGASQRQGHEAVQAVHAQLSSGSLQKLVAAPLGEVQGMLQRETVLWSRGLMAQPPGVQAMLQAQLSLLHVLAALHITLVQQPLQAHDLSSDALYRWLLQPCKEEFEDLCNELISIGVEICSMMTCGRHAGMQTILERLHAINAERARMRARWNDRLQQLHEATAAAGHALVSPADSIRVMSWMHAFLKALDRATMVGRTAVQEKAYFHDSVLSYLWGPFGWWRRQLRLQHLHTSP